MSITEATNVVVQASPDAAVMIAPSSAAPLPSLPADATAISSASLDWSASTAVDLLRHGSAAAGTGITTHEATMRINQLDAASLDSELSLMLQHALRRCFQFFDGSNSSMGFLSANNSRAEIELVISSAVFLYTTARNEPTPGMKLQNLQFQNYAAVRQIAQNASSASAAGASSLSGRFSISSMFQMLSSWLALGTSKPLLTKGTGATTIDSLRDLIHNPSSSTASSSTIIPLSNFIDTLSPEALQAIGPVASAAGSHPAAILLSPLPSHSATLLSKQQKVLYFACSILLRYLWSKFSHHMTMEGWGGLHHTEWRKKVYKLARRIEQLYQAVNIMNFVIFLRQGCYRSLLERLLSIRMLYLRPRISRAISFEFMNQQIAWAALSEFMLFLLPLINFGAVATAFKWVRKVIGMDAKSNQPNNGAVDSMACPVCHTSPAVQPYRALPCQHVFCYYCLAGNRLAEQQQSRGSSAAAGGSQFHCPTCEEVIVNQTPF